MIMLIVRNHRRCFEITFSQFSALVMKKVGSVLLLIAMHNCIRTRKNTGDATLDKTMGPAEKKIHYCSACFRKKGRLQGTVHPNVGGKSESEDNENICFGEVLVFSAYWHESGEKQT